MDGPGEINMFYVQRSTMDGITPCGTIFKALIYPADFSGAA
jgi:hypothetical protein